MFETREITSPYPGLRPFEPHEAEIFFGCEAHTDRLLEILRRERFLAVVGPSGCGKSSLVRAGMIPALAAGWLGTGSVWRIAIMRPGDRPLRGLAVALLRPQALAAELSSAPEVTETRARTPGAETRASREDATLGRACRPCTFHPISVSGRRSPLARCRPRMSTCSRATSSSSSISGGRTATRTTGATSIACRPF